ncbi:MAG: oxidoreductase, partial [Alphaproteobacteria bacterium]
MDQVSDAAYPHLFSPFTLGRLTLANRIMIPAMTTNYAEPDGSIGDKLIDYLVERARGGFGAIVTENIGVDPGGRVMAQMVMADNDQFLPGLTRLAKSVKAEGAVLFGQISHAGRQTRSAITGQPLVAPSPIPCPLNREMPIELSIPDIEKLEQAFIDTACRLAKAGFDGVEIHGAHGYLVGGFLSPHSNKRTDIYGGSLENRMRFLSHILRGIKERLGDDFPIIVRISAEEFVENGLDATQSIEIAQRLENEGIHALSISVGVYGSFNKVSMITGEPEGQWIELAGRVKAGTGLPIIGVGRIKRAQVAEAGLAAGSIDIAAVGRATIADADFAHKLFEGREDDINWC